MQGNSMTWTPLPVTEWMLIGLCCLSTVYITVAALMRHGSRPGNMTRPGSHGTGFATISVLKPLCGLEPRLYANLETFCRQTHPCFQLLFGVSSATDPAVGVVNRLREAYPDLDITLVVNDSVHGVNLKVSNLINLAQHARHEIIVIADSDIAVPPDYLHTVSAPLRSAWSPASIARGAWAKCGPGSARFSSTSGSCRRCTSRERPARAVSVSAQRSRCGAKRL